MNTKIRIGHYLPQYGTSTGTGQVIKKLTEFLMGHRYIELVIFKVGEKFETSEEDNVKIVSFLPSKSKYLLPIGFLDSLRTNKYELDSLGIHMPFTTHNLIIQLLSRVPIDYFPHGCFAPKTLNKKDKKFKKKIFFHLIEKRIITKARKVICATEKEETYMMNLGFQNTIVAYFPFTPPKLSIDFELSFRKQYKLKQNEFLIIFVGRFDVYVKGIDILIQAVKKANKANSLIKGILIGYNRNKPNEVDNLIKTFKSNHCIINVGPLFGEAKYDALLSANAYVQASRFESFGVSILEPLSLKIPCILSEGCDISGPIYKSNGCYSFDGSIESLTDKILAISSDSSKSKVVADNGYIWVTDNLSNSKLKSKWESVYALESFSTP